MAGSGSKGLLEVLQDGTHSAFSSAAAVWADLTQAGGQKQDWGMYSSMDSSSSRTFARTLRDTTEEFMAHLRWSTPLLQPNTHVPLPTHWDTRTILAFLDCLRSIQHSFVTEVAAAVDGDLDTDSTNGSSSSSTYLTMPPVTAALAAALLLVFTRPGGVALKDVALSPYCVLVKKEYWRLLSCHLVHLDAAHLLTNLSALLPDCASLEAAEGTAAFAGDLLLLGLAASCAYVASALLHKSLLGRPAQYYSMVTVGASSLGFALKVWAGYRCRSSQSHLLGLLHLPSQFAWVPTLALTHLLVPQASFTAHMAGVCAGLCRAYALEPVVRGCSAAWRSLTGVSSRSRVRGGGRRLGGGVGLEQQQHQQPSALHLWRRDQHRHFLDTSSSGVGEPAGSAEQLQHGHSGSSSSWWYGWVPATEVLLQCGCVGAAVGVYLLICTGTGGQQQGRSHSTSIWWR